MYFPGQMTGMQNFTLKFGVFDCMGRTGVGLDKQ
jgi:hypothetical protein